eukprot:403339334
MNSSRVENKLLNTNTQTSFSQFSLTNRNVKHSKLDLTSKLNASVDNLNQNDFMNNMDENEQQQQLIHAPHPLPNINMSSNNNQSSNNSSAMRIGNHQRITGYGAISGHHVHHQSLSETRSLKSFKSLQDQRLQRQLNRKNETSNQGSNSSQTRQRSNVREMLQTQEEKKLFESKFKGSLDKLDEFERQWSDFKVNQPATSNSQSQSRMITELELVNNKQEINSNVDYSQSKTQSLGQKIQGNYQTQVQPVQKDPRNKPNIELKNQLHQINESPRESILQSPSSNYNDKLRSLYQPPKTAFQSLQRPLLINEKQNSNGGSKECKTLKIDLNEERLALEQKQQQSKALMKSGSKTVKSEESKVEIKNLIQEKSSSSQKQSLMMPKKKPSSTVQQTQQSTPLSSFQFPKPQQLEQGRNQAKSSIKDPIISQSVSQFQAKDDLVERVIESIKVLNQKEEEVKEQKLSSNVQAKPKPISKEATIQQQEQTLQLNQMRRRTNTLTTGERPNLLHNKAQTNQNQQQPTLLKENSQPMHQQIAQLKKQVSQSSQPIKDLKIQQPSSTTNQQATAQGFIGNSFVKIAQEKQEQSNQSSKTTEKKEKQDSNQANDPYQYNMQYSSKQIKLGQQQTQNNQQNKTPALTQASKEKVEQLRKAFTNNKDGGQSRSTKNLNSVPSQSHQSAQQQIQLITQKQNMASQIKSLSNNSSQITTPVGSVSQKQSQNMLPIKSEKLTKRADISLVNDCTPSNNISINNYNASQNTSLSITTGTPNKTSISNLKKSTQMTPQNKLSTTSPSQQSSSLNLTGSSSSLPTVMQNNLHLKRNSQQAPSLHSANISSNTIGQNTSTLPQKGKNRRQPTQTQFDPSSQNLIKNDQANKNAASKKQFELVERVDGQKIEQKKQVTLLDDYFHGTPPNLRNPSKNTSNKGSHNNSKQISLSKHKDKSLAHSQLDQELAEVERQFLERPKLSNFQPIQEPSINWNASPEKRMPERKLFNDNKLDIIKQVVEPPRSHREQYKILDDRFQQNNNKFLQNEVHQSEPQEQQYHSSRPATRTQMQQKLSLKLDSKIVENQRKNSENSDESQNPIEKRLNKLMEETRRKLIHQDEEDYDTQDMDQSVSQVSEEHFNYQNHKQMTEALGRLEESNQAMNRMRNKAQTPQINSQQNFTGGGSHQQMQYQMQHAPPQPYSYEPHQQFQQVMYNQQYPGYGHQIIYPGQGGAQQPQPMITIINPAMQYQQPHHPYSMFPGTQMPNEMGYQSYQPHNVVQNDMTVSGNSPTLIPSHQNRPLKQAQMNTSMIIGTDSQFFYPNSNNNNGTSQDNSLVNNNEDDSAIHLPPKQLSQVVIPQNQLLYQQPMYQPHHIGGAMHQQQLQQQQFYIVGYPPHHQSQIYQQPPPGYIPQNYVQPHLRQASDSFQQQQQFQAAGMNANQSSLSYENPNVNHNQLSSRGSPNTHHQQIQNNVSMSGTSQNSVDKKQRSGHHNNSASHLEEL